MRKFKRIYIEITNTCNLSCEFCPKTKRKLSFMSIDSFKHILKEIRPFTDHIYYHILGEPLLHPNLGDFLKLSSDFDYKVNLTTNGTLIRDQFEILLTAQALRQVNFSLHSFDANERNYSFEDYMNHIFDFIDAARVKSDIICSLRLWNMQEFDHVFSKEVSLIDTVKNEHVLSIIQQRLNLKYDLRDELRQNNRLRLADRVYLNMATRFEWPDISVETSDLKGFCHGLRDQIGILVDGTVVPCCLDGEGTINLGNVFENSFGDIINSERASKMYEGFSRREISEELCRKCDYRRRFNK